MADNALSERIHRRLQWMHLYTNVYHSCSISRTQRYQLYSSSDYPNIVLLLMDDDDNDSDDIIDNIYDEPFVSDCDDISCCCYSEQYVLLVSQYMNH